MSALLYGELSTVLPNSSLQGAKRRRVPDAVQRSSRCTAEPGPMGATRLNHGPRISSAPRRESGALRSIRGTQTQLRIPAAQSARVVQEALAPKEGAGNA